MRITILVNGVIETIAEGPSLADAQASRPDAVCRAWVAGDVPAPRTTPVILSDKEYRDLFTQAEQDSLLAAAVSGDVNARRILLQLQTASTGVDLSSPNVAAGLSYMVAKGWFTEARKLQILACR